MQSVKFNKVVQTSKRWKIKSRNTGINCWVLSTNKIVGLGFCKFQNCWEIMVIVFERYETFIALLKNTKKSV